MFFFTGVQELGWPTEVTRVGTYKIIHWRHDNIGRVVIKDRRNRTVAQASDVDAKIWSMTNHGARGHPEVCIYTWTGGAHASFAYYIIGLGPKPKCLLAFWQGNGDEAGDFEVKDLRRDGRKEIVTSYDGFAYRLGLGYSPVYVPMVLELSGGRYVDTTKKYPELAVAASAKALKDLEEAIRERKAERESLAKKNYDLANEEDYAYGGPGIRRNAIGFLASKILLGRETRAWKYLRTLLPHGVYKNLRQNRTWIRRVVADRKLRIRHPALSQIPLKWNDINDADSPWGDK